MGVSFNYLLFDPTLSDVDSGQHIFPPFRDESASHSGFVLQRTRSAGLEANVSLTQIAHDFALSAIELQAAHQPESTESLYDAVQAFRALAHVLSKLHLWASEDAHARATIRINSEAGQQISVRAVLHELNWAPTSYEKKYRAFTWAAGAACMRWNGEVPGK